MEIGSVVYVVMRRIGIVYVAVELAIIVYVLSVLLDTRIF